MSENKPLIWDLDVLTQTIQQKQNKLVRTLELAETVSDLFFEEHVNGLKQVYDHSNALDKTFKDLEIKRRDFNTNIAMQTQQMNDNITELNKMVSNKSFIKIQLSVEYLLKKTCP